MFSIQLKITNHTKNQENHYLNEKRQSTDDNTKINHMVEVSEKYFKLTVTQVLQQSIINSLETKENFTK